MKRLLTAAGVALALGACNDQFSSLNGKATAPIPQQTVALMSEKGMTKSDPMLIRLYKKESEMEVWKKGVDGHYAMLKSFPICRWSGQLGPKRKEGDRQTPEGFYTITPGQMNPNSAYYLSFDTGYPNAYDRAHDGTGSALMVHGTCSSRGCYAMTDEGIAEIYALARESFSGGQRGIQFQAYPFRMTAENLAKFRHDPNMPFWRNLKEGSDNFEVTKREAKVAVCGGRYAFNTVGDGCKPDPTLAPLLAEKQDADRQAVAELVAKGTPAVRLVYADGGQHESFRSTALAAFSGDAGRNFAVLETRAPRNLGDVSRPDALAEGPREIAMDGPAGKAPLVIAAVSRKAAPAAKPTALVLASAAEPPPAAAPQPATAEARPFYERVLGNVLSAKEPDSAVEPGAAPAVADAKPLPPRRALVGGPARTSPPVKPQAAVAVPQRHVDAGGAITTAALARD